MKQQKSNNRQKQSNPNYRGQGMAFGAALGLIFGMLLFDDIALGLVLGVAIGLGIGSIVDMQTKKERK